MADKRINQVNELIRQEMGKFFLGEIEFPKGCLVTIFKVETSSDLEHAKIKLSVLPVNFQGKVLKILNKKIYHLQKLLDKRLVMHYVPKIRFVIDYSLEKAEKINELLDKIKKE